MTEDVVIRFENVSKRYKRTFGGLRHLVQDAANKLIGRNDGGHPEERYLWAVRDVSFDVCRGEILGVIGLNGAGKSTILKLASRITHPTGGNIEIKGQVGALIEVGAGFHPELSGKENVYLNGSILGMSRDEIEAKYESIVDFAELNGFMDMPVKRYSSGMYVRLGFAVAAHLEPDIFLIDEVLAVGDAGFQVKCVKKIRELRDSGTTVLLVSHNLTNIAHYCDRALWINQGIIQSSGDPESLVDEYIDFINERSRRDFEAADNSQVNLEGAIDFNSGNSTIITDAVITNQEGEKQNTFACGDIALIDIYYDAVEEICNPIFGLSIFDVHGKFIGSITNLFSDYSFEKLKGKGKVSFKFDPIIFLKGIFEFHVYIRSATSYEILSYKKLDDKFIVKGSERVSEKKIIGTVNYPHKWIVDN